MLRPSGVQPCGSCRRNAHRRTGIWTLIKTTVRHRILPAHAALRPSGVQPCGSCRRNAHRRTGIWTLIKTTVRHRTPPALKSWPAAPPAPPRPATPPTPPLPPVPPTPPRTPSPPPPPALKSWPAAPPAPPRPATPPTPPLPPVPPTPRGKSASRRTPLPTRGRPNDDRGPVWVFCRARLGNGRAWAPREVRQPANPPTHPRSAQRRPRTGLGVLPGKARQTDKLAVMNPTHRMGVNRPRSRLLTPRHPNRFLDQWGAQMTDKLAVMNPTHRMGVNRPRSRLLTPRHPNRFLELHPLSNPEAANLLASQLVYVPLPNGPRRHRHGPPIRRSGLHPLSNPEAANLLASQLVYVPLPNGPRRHRHGPKRGVTVRLMAMRRKLYVHAFRDAKSASTPVTLHSSFGR